MTSCNPTANYEIKVRDVELRMTPIRAFVARQLRALQKAA